MRDARTAVPSQLVVPALAAVTVAASAAANGGYFPTAWGWLALALFAVAAVAVVVRSEIWFGRGELVALVAAAGLFAWTLASAAWASSATWPVRESERMLAYVGALLAMLSVTRRSTHRLLLGGTWAAISITCCYSLAARLFPGWHSRFNALAGYRLSEPIGYWNGLGIFAALGLLLALAVAVRSHTAVARALAGGSLPVLATALYFTYSRGAWIALGVGLLAAVVVDSRRLQLLAQAIGLVVPTAAAVAIASQSSALTHLTATRADAAHDGHRFAIELLLLAALAALLSLGFAVAEKRIVVPRQARSAFAGALVIALVASLAAAVVHYGGPTKLVRRGYHSLNANAPQRADLNARLFNLSSPQRINHWRVAWHEFEVHPILGSGAGTYQQYWLADRTNTFNVRNAHSLYLETLATLGPVGLALVVVLLAAPLVACLRTRRGGFVGLATGAYVAFLAHAAIDWDWQLPAVTIAALACGAAMLVAARGTSGPLRLDSRGRFALAAVAVVAATAAFVALVSNTALSASARAAQNDHWQSAEAQAQKAIDWAPWSSTGWQELGEAQLQQGDLTAARRSFRRAIAKDRRNWNLWFELALSSTSKSARRDAAAVALRLNPLSPEIHSLRSFLGVGVEP